MTPVTVLMAVRNGSRTIRTAVDSVLRQTYSDFRFLILDDESTDDTREILRSYRDSRIDLVPLERNVGQTAALNLGLRKAQTPWIARMDADDFSAPDRLERQMQALERSPEIQCVGTAIWEFREDPSVADRVVHRPAKAEEIRRAAFLGQGLIHGSVVIGRQALLDCGGYDERYRYASDREMFIRFLGRYKAANLAKPLMGIRRHVSQDSYSKRAADEYIDIFARLLSGGDHSGPEREILRDGLSYSYIFRADWFRSNHQYGRSLTDLLRSFRTSPRRAIRTLGGRAVRSVSGKKP